MKRLGLFGIILLTLSLEGCMDKFEYPKLPEMEPVTEDFFGTKITDEHRSLEDLTDSANVNWFIKQKEFARSFLDNITERAALVEKMEEFDTRKPERNFDLTITDNDQYFYLKQKPGEENASLYHRDGFNGEEHLLFDPNTLDNDESTRHVISHYLPSKSGKNVAIEITLNGTENGVLKIMNVEHKTFHKETVLGANYSASSWIDDTTFMYTLLNSSDVHSNDVKLSTTPKIHTLGRAFEEDPIIFSKKKFPDLDIQPEEIPKVFYAEALDLVFCYLYTVERSQKVYYCNYADLLTQPVWKSLIKRGDQISGITYDQNHFYFKSFKDAPNYKILRTELKNPIIDAAEIIIPEDSDGLLQGFTMTADGLFITKRYKGIEQKLFHLENNELKEIETPLVPAGGIGLSSKGFEFNDLWIGVSGWTSEYQRYRFNFKENVFTKEMLTPSSEYPEFQNLKVEELTVTSHDGTEVPLSLVYDSTTKIDQNTPVFINGYGAYGSIISPAFRPVSYLWTAYGGIMAYAHVRGGGELGKKWHTDGQKLNKPNTWKDLIACAEHLIDKGYTNKEKIAINAGSAGGILVGRAMTERPDLFKAVITEVGVMNTLRKEFTPNGPVNIPEYGTVEDSLGFKGLFEMDSYHHLEKGVEYPATLITAGYYDSRVIAWNPGKFAARLQEYNGSKNPILFYTNFEAGHGQGSTRSQLFNKYADKMAFAFWQLGHPKFQLKQ